MLTNNKQKLIVSLQQKKYRNEHQLFVIEGVKIISEFILSTNLITEVFISHENQLSAEVMSAAAAKGIEIALADEKSIQRISTQSTSQHCIALAKIFAHQTAIESLKNEVSIVLDQIQDPGNLGTIIRTADWFGIKNIYCSVDTVDCYNSKVVQSSMGSLCNVNLHYVSLQDLLSQTKLLGIKVFGTLLNGNALKETSIEKGSMLVFGNEANGISAEIKEYIDQAITISKSASTHAESLNVATTVAIVLASI
jgi:TrmH family RNA methyltransferase